jgi:glycosyltransferase 2 family protein
LPRWLRDWLVLFLKLAATAGVLGFFIHTIDGAELLDVAAGAQVWPLVLAASLSLSRMLLAAKRLQVLLDAHTRLPLLRLLRHCFIGMFFNQLFPTAVGGDAVRVLLLRREGGIPMEEGAVFVLVDRVLALCALAAIALVAAPFAGLPPDIVWLPVVTGAAVLVGGATLAGLGRAGLFNRLPGELLRRAAAALALLLRLPRALLGAAALSMAFQGLAIFETWLIAVSLGVSLSLAAALALVPLVYIATVLPLSFGGVGVRELAFVMLFVPLGIAEEASLALALGSFASLALPGVVGGALWLVRPRGSPVSAPSSTPPKGREAEGREEGAAPEAAA